MAEAQVDTMFGLDPNDPVARAMADQVAMKRQRDDNEGRQGDGYGDVEFTELPDGEWVVVRILDQKFILRGQVLGIDGYGHFIHWPTRGLMSLDSDPNYILSRFYDSVTAGEWEDNKDPSSKSKRKFVYTHVGHPTLMWMLTSRATTKQEQPFEFSPKAFVACNVITRGDPTILATGHTKLLSSKLSKANKKTGRYPYATPGIPWYKCFSKVIDLVEAKKLHYLFFDVAFKKNVQNIEYSVSSIANEDLPVEKRMLGSMEPLSPAELAYTRYDLNAIFKPTSYAEIQQIMGHQMALWDSNTSKGPTLFAEELRSLVAQEFKDQPASTNTVVSVPANVSVPIPSPALGAGTSAPMNGQGTSVPQIPTSASVAPIPSSVTVPSTPTAVRIPREVSTKIEPGQVGVAPPIPFEKRFQHWEVFDEPDRAALKESILDFDAKGIPIYDLQKCRPAPCTNPLCVFPGTTVTTIWPPTVYHCGVCGVAFEDIPAPKKDA